MEVKIVVNECFFLKKNHETEDIYDCDISSFVKRSPAPYKFYNLQHKMNVYLQMYHH